MSLDSRLRADLLAIAETVEPEVEPVLAALMAGRESDERSRGVLPRVLAAAACLVLVAGLTIWWLGRAHGHENDFVNDPAPPTGTYAARLAGDLAGDWRLRFADEIVSVVAPDRTATGRRSAFGSYEVEDGTFTTDLLGGDGPCSGPGTYRWSREQDRLQLRVVDDGCKLREQILTSGEWRPVQGERFLPGTYRTKLTIDLMRRTALAEGFAREDIDAYLDGEFPGATRVIYTLQAEEGVWWVHETIDGSADETAWQGSFTVLDAATVQAIASDISCGPIIYDVRADAGTVSFVLVTDACPTPGTTSLGELIAQTTIYESRPFTRLND